MIITTPRTLVTRRLGHTHLSPARVERAMTEMVDQNWIPNLTPTAEDYNRPLVFVHVTNPWAHLFARTVHGAVELPRGEIEARTDALINASDSGKKLGKHGLAIIDRGTHTVSLRATSPILAKLVNRCRYMPGRATANTARLIEMVLGLSHRPVRLTDEMRLRTAYGLESWRLQFDGLLEQRDRVTLASAWHYSIAVTSPTSPEIPF